MTAPPNGPEPSAEKDELREAIRGAIVDEIGKRCGQIPDVHPRLLEGIEEAARIIVTYVLPPAGGHTS